MKNKVSYEEWLKWREEYFKEESHMLNKEELTEEQQMAAYEEDLKNSDWGHQPC